jgi:hypothetical protein
MGCFQAETVAVSSPLRATRAIRRVLFFALVLFAALTRISALAAEETFPHREYRDIVAVSVGDRQIVLATLADLERFRLPLSRSLGAPQWRFRRVRIPSRFDNPDVMLAASGTKILFTETGNHELLDISRRVNHDSVASHRPTMSSSRSPNRNPPRCAYSQTEVLLTRLRDSWVPSARTCMETALSFSWTAGQTAI